MTTTQEPPQIVPPLRPLYLEAVKKSNRGQKKNSRYSKEVKDVLKKHKDMYRKATTRNERHDLFRNFILVDIFNFWYEKGEVTPDIDQAALSKRIKVSSYLLNILISQDEEVSFSQTLSMWIRNNWRSYHTSNGLIRNERKKSRVDVVWLQMQKRVEDEMNTMLAEEGRTGEANSEDTFRLRTTACNRVFQGLSLEDQALINKLIQEGADIVPNDVKQK
jgi:hypothetical protein